MRLAVFPVLAFCQDSMMPYGLQIVDTPGMSGAQVRSCDSQLRFHEMQERTSPSPWLKL